MMDNPTSIISRQTNNKDDASSFALPQKMTPQSHSTPKQADRKTLQTLQPSASGNGQLNGGLHSKTHHELRAKALVTSVQSPLCGLSVFQDPQPPRTSRVHCTRETQTELTPAEIGEDSGLQSATESKEAFDLLINDVPSESYWKDLAEERRRALLETLQENEKLTEEVEHLRTENTRLSHIEEKAEALQRLLKDILPEEDLEEAPETEDLEEAPETEDSALSDTAPTSTGPVSLDEHSEVDGGPK